MNKKTGNLPKLTKIGEVIHTKYIGGYIYNTFCFVVTNIGGLYKQKLVHYCFQNCWIIIKNKRNLVNCTSQSWWSYTYKNWWMTDPKAGKIVVNKLLNYTYKHWLIIILTKIKWIKLTKMCLAESCLRVRDVIAITSLARYSGPNEKEQNCEKKCVCHFR